MVEALMRENGIGVAPAGSGKTVMGMRYIYEKGKRHYGLRIQKT